MASILVVEDERIIAQDIERLLARMGHTISKAVSNAQDALQAAAASRPDLVLMDVHLKGELDGVACAHILRERFRVPIVYLTAHADEATVARAAATEPFGYVIKPFHGRNLQSSIEIALYKHEMETRSRERERWLASLLRSLPDAVIAADGAGHVRYMNASAERMTGYRLDQLQGQPLSTALSAGDAPLRALAEGCELPLPADARCLVRDAESFSVEGSAAPLVDQGTAQGAVVLFRRALIIALAPGGARAAEGSPSW